MKLNEGQEQTDEEFKEMSIKQVLDEFEVQANTITELDKQVSNLSLQVAKYEGRAQVLDKEVESDSYFHSRTTTRELARRALAQSTVEANWEGLEKHPTILNLYQAIKDRRNEQEQRIELVLQRFEGQPTGNEFITWLEKSTALGDIKNEISNLWSRVEQNTTSQGNDRSQANKQDLKQRDKMSDLETAIDALEFLGSEREITYGSVFMFLIGVFAEMGKGQVEEGLRFMLKKPKEKPEKDEPEQS